MPENFKKGEILSDVNECPGKKGSQKRKLFEMDTISLNILYTVENF